MGCGASSTKNSPDEMTIRSTKQSHPLVNEQASPIQKIRASEAIKKNDKFLVNKMLQEITPLHNLGIQGENYTWLHVAAQFNSFYTMEVCIAWLKSNKSSDINTIMNIPGPDDQIPVVKAIIQDASETFYVMLKEGVIPMNYKNEKGLTVEQICRQHSFNCLHLLERQTKGNQPDQKEEKPIKQEDVIINSSQKFADEHEKELAIRKLNNAIAKLEKAPVKGPESDKDIKSANSIHADLQGIPSQSQVYKILSKLIKTGGEVFLDSSFPPNISSILSENTHEYMKEFKECVWKRPHDLFGCGYDQIQVFDNIEPNDIAQGLLGVCYFLASLSALTEFPSRLTPIYVNKTTNKYGVYGMKFYIKGVPTEVVVDDHFPCYGDRKNEPLFSKPKGKELWVLLAEKAWAKIYKNYIACEAGFMDEALEYLLGTPSIRYVTKDQEISKIWEILLEADNNKHILCAATYGTVKEEMGLIANHAYSLISCHHVNNYRILKLRNPWGKFEWKGNFSDNSKLWTEELKSKVGYVKADDGVFFMTVEDFKKNFEFYSIGLYHEGWEYTYVEAESDPKHAEYFKFTVDQPCHVYFRIHQSDKRHLTAKEQEEFEYASADLVLAKVETDGTYRPILDDPKNVDVGSFWGARSIFPTKNHKLYLDKPGEYIIRTKLRWRQGAKDKFTLSAYAPVKIEMQHVKPMKDFLSRLLKNVGQKAEKTDMEDGCQMSYGFYSHYLYMYLENTSKKKWSVSITFDEMQNLRLRKPYLTQGNTLSITVPAGQKIAAYAKKQDITAGASYSWSFEETRG